MHTVHGRKGSYDYPYVQRLDYDKFGQRSYVLHGNNTVSRYSYRKTQVDVLRQPSSQSMR